ncbi:MAG: hypothetical protein NC308_10595 [Clostridium sp.]|nr:hypothetical protein [Bacteroides sp.]MCM1199323.1 hypothetical protein [Clostridium sp.]
MSRIAIVLMLMVPAFSSCRLVNSLLHDGEVVARVGSNMLYKGEVSRLIPDGIPAEDSLRLAMQYINTWASDMVFLDMAESQLSKGEKDVSKELEDYRRSLLKYRYEQIYVNERLDTAVTSKEVEEYYSSHPKDFVLVRPIVKARSLKISQASPDIDHFRKMMSSFGLDGGWTMDDFSSPTVGQFTTYSDKWIDLDILARDMEMELSMLDDVKAGKFYENVDSYGLLNVAYIVEVLPAGTTSPVEYCTPAIRDLIISARKHRLTTSLERDLLEDARDKGKFVIY